MMMMTIHHSGGHALQVGPLGKLGKPPFDCIEKCVKGVNNNNNNNNKSEFFKPTLESIHPYHAGAGWGKNQT